MSGLDMEDEREREGEEEEDQEDGAPAEGSVAWSIFASYYGLEEQPGSPTVESEGQHTPLPAGGHHREHKSASDLDSVHFNPESFVRVLLDNAPIDELLSRDTQMTHEIRALDSDMQMLVYENYNKFISATETIKRMKSNVDAMDADMDTVRYKMSSITSSSAALDESLEGKRQKVDKLVRVRRLLERLEFLSELPEKLASLIAREQYQRAVQLYRRTIHVLTQHAQVLSFRKIKERTEAMMGDLRGKVTDLLADPSLEAVKLTQYASILRLMEAPRAVVCEKLLLAHRSRSLQLVKRFTASASVSASTNTSITTTTTPGAAPTTPASDSTLAAPSSSSSSSSSGGSEGGTTVSRDDEFASGSSSDRARRFHQDLLVGLIEACRGLHELYSPKPASLQRPHSKSSSAAAAAFLLLSPKSGSNIGNDSGSLGTSVPATPLSLPKETPASPEEVRAAAVQFRSLLETVLPAYKTCLVSATANFFERFNAQTLHLQHLEAALKAEQGGSDAAIGDSAAAQAVRASQLHFYALDDERQAWVTLVRQTIMDVQFLDREAEACLRDLRQLLDTGLASRKEERGKSDTSTIVYSPDYSMTLLFTLDQHLQTCLERRVGVLVASLPSIETGIALLEEKEGDNSAGPESIAEQHKRSLGKRSEKAKAAVDQLSSLFFSLLGEFCSDAKEIVDVHSAVAPAAVDDYVLQLVSRFVATAAQACESACGVCASSLNSRHAVIRAGDLVGNLAEVLGNEATGRIASEQVSGCGVSFQSPEFPSLGGGVRCLIVYAVLSNLRASLGPRLEHELTAHGLALGFDLLKPCRLWAEQVDDAACRVIFRFVEHHAEECAALARDCVTSALRRECVGAGAGKVCSEMRKLVLRLDRLTTTCCLSLGESLTQFQKLDEYTRRGAAHRANPRNTNQLQLNIDRLFAQRVSIFPSLQAFSSKAGGGGTSAIGPLELVVSAVIKTAIKSAQESLRSRTIRQPEHLQQLVLDLTFFRKCAGSFLPSAATGPAHDIDWLHDQLFATLASRSSGGEGGVGVNAMQSEVVAEEMKRISRQTIVI